MHESPSKTDMVGEPRSGSRSSRMIRSEDLEHRRKLAVLRELHVNCEILNFENAPTLNLARAMTLNAPKPPGNGLTMKVDYFSSKLMEEYLRKEFGRRAAFDSYQVCDVGFWDADASTDTGLGWHNDFNWNRLLAPSNRSFHGWFVNSFTGDCNFTLAVSTDASFNECNTNVSTKIFYIRSDDVIKPDVIVPLQKNTVIIFPYGSAHRTFIADGSNRLVGRRLSTSFVLHHKEDRLDENKISDLSDDELRILLTRYPLEKTIQSNHYIIKLLEDNSRTGPLVKKMLETSTQLGKGGK